MESLDTVTQRIQELITCRICEDIPHMPRGLPCLHVFCEECLREHTEMVEPGVEFPCPQCHEQTTLPDNGVDGLTKAFINENLVEIYNQMSCCRRRSALSRLTQEIKDLARCAICQDTFEHPLGLPCLHVFCRSCLNSHIEATVVNIEILPQIRQWIPGLLRLLDPRVQCPLCNMKIHIPYDCVDEFPCATLQINLIELHEAMEIVELGEDEGRPEDEIVRYEPCRSRPWGRVSLRNTKVVAVKMALAVGLTAVAVLLQEMA